MAPILEKYGLIGQFVAVSVAGGEESGQAPPHALHRHAAAGGEIALAEALSDFVA
jgi:hypothetical protein